MPNPVIVGVGLSGASALAQRGAANKAAKAQGAAADAQIAETRRQFDTIRQLLSPWVAAGNDALSQQLALMGLGGYSTSAAPEITTIPGAANTNAPGARAPFGSMGGISSSGDRGVGQITQAAGPTGQTQYVVNGQAFGTLQEAQAFAQANRTRTFSQADANAAQAQAISALENGSQFKALVRSGEDSILANAAATGGLRGGNTQGALAQYRPAMLQALIDKQLANLGGLSANGQNAAASVGSAAQSSGAQIAQFLGDKGAAQAGSYLAGGKALGNFFGDISGGLGSFVGANGGIPKGVGIFDKWGF